MWTTHLNNATDPDGTCTVYGAVTMFLTWCAAVAVFVTRSVAVPGHEQASVLGPQSGRGC